MLGITGILFSGALKEIIVWQKRYSVMEKTVHGATYIHALKLTHQ